MYAILLAFLAAGASSLLIFLVMRKKASAELEAMKGKVAETASREATVTERARLIAEQRDQLRDELTTARSVQTDLGRQVSAKVAENQGLKERLEETSKITENLKVGMEDIMRRVHEASHDRAAKATHERLDALINPFKERLDNFGKTVRETYDQGMKETMSLKSQLEHVFTLEKGILQQTENLTRALKGDSKAQGDWGEMVLEGLLERAGLRDGHEFIVQGVGLGLRSETGSTRKPDVVVRLPQEKDVIIDSKVSLTSYDQYFACTADDERQQAAEALLESIEGHIKDLSKKDYASLYGINAPDYVLLFIPNDGAYLLAAQTDPGLYGKALEKGVHLVSPSFLMPALRMIHNLWERDKQSKNAIKIAEDAGKLYDKFVDFVADVQSVQEAIGKAGAAADSALKRLQSGSGNLITRTENLRKLGAKAKKQLKDVEEVSEDEGEGHSKGPLRIETAQPEALSLVAHE